MQELDKQATEYGSSMDAMQMSLDEIRRQCADKDSKLDQLRMTLEQYEKQEVRSSDFFYWLLNQPIVGYTSGSKKGIALIFSRLC